MNLREKVAIVTGSGGEGCGRAIAIRFASEGARVVVSDINEAGGAETVRLIEQHGGSAAFCRADVREEEQVRKLIEFAEKRFGGLHVLVNDASGPVRFAEPLEYWEDTIRTELLGTMYATRFAIEAMRRSGGGAIINVSSTSALSHGRKLPGLLPSYDVAKAGVLRLTTTLAWLGEEERIRVNCIVPHWIGTPELLAYVASLTVEERTRRGVPARLITLDEICDSVMRLVTDESLAGRALVIWSGDSPQLIPWADPGYAALE
jgi:NAD(P)-dependent dehydrogenase (short-subunit alcohol dehydrogenase family)